jgi:predicted O-linked N-acetylglucosamine transferase (SPINDLY family)
MTSELIETAQMFLAAGLPARAAGLCQKVLNLKPDDTGALHLLGVLEQQSGRSEIAKNLFARLATLEPENPAAWSNCGVACLSLGEREEAQLCFENAVQLAPGYAEAWNNLGSAHQKGNISKAEECFRRALDLNPGMVDACNNLALICKKLQRYNEAISYYRQSLAINPEQAIILGRLAELLEQASDTDGARNAYRESITRKPDDALSIKMATVLPVILESADVINPLRENLWHSIQELGRHQLQVGHIGENARTLFYLAYHGRNDRPFHEAMGRIYRSAAPGLTWQAPHTQADRTPDGRIKVGFISRFFYNHTIAKLNIGYIEKLDRSRFHVTVLVISTGMFDGMTRRFQDAADGFVLLNGDLSHMREQVAEQQLDILLYTDIGMEPWSYLLAFSRLAPVQCVTWGHPATSGIDTIDYFISHQDCETDESLSAYSEKLFCLSRAATCTCYAKPALESSGKSLESFGIDPGRTIYYCPQTPFKMHPDFDQALAQILERDPNGLIVLLRGGMPQTEQLLRERFRKTIPDADQRIQFMETLPFADYIAMMEQADVVLDTFHFSGGNSSVEGFAVGAPIVTLPSPFLKGRLTYAWYQRLGIQECIARNAEEYVTIAVALGTDRPRRVKLRQRIKAASQLLFDDLQAVRELEAFFERVCLK